MDSPDISDPSFNWLPISTSTLTDSSPWWEWVSDTGSLTHRLKVASRQNFNVEVIEERWVTDLPESVRLLFGPLAKSHQFWSRKVNLVGCGNDWVQAHTLIPQHSLLSPLRKVMELNSQPLGEYLFNQPNLLRSELDVTPMCGDTWGRRSLFFLFNKPILVAEFFLNDLLESKS